MSPIVIYLLYAVIGGVAGLLGGLLGIGGGVVTVPCLFYLFHLLDLPPAFTMHMAIATSLAAMVFSAATSTWIHHRKRNVLWAVFRNFAPGIIIGSILGAVTTSFLPEFVLEIFFGVFLCCLGVYFYRQKAVVDGSHKLPSPLVVTGLGGLAGMLSNLLGIGGGSFMVPLLSFFRIRDKNAIGTSAAITCVTLACGSISYLILDWNEIPNESLGLIQPSAFFIVGIFAVCFAPIGVHLTSILNPQKIRRIFAVVLVLTGISLFL